MTYEEDPIAASFLGFRIEFFLDPAEADSLVKMPGSRNGNAKRRLLLEAMNGVENQGRSIGSPSR